MWSGPRNISTAMMRSFEARPDTVVVDEPLYAHYLAVTGIDHPGREHVMASQPTRWARSTADSPASLRMSRRRIPRDARAWSAEVVKAAGA